MKNIIRIDAQRGSVLLLVLAGIAGLAVMAVIGSTLLGTMVSGNQRYNISINTGQILTQAAYTITTEANTAGSYPVAAAPTAWSGTNPSSAPGQGSANAVGLVTAASAAPKVDAWGSNIGYCTYTATSQSSPVFAVISAGPDKVFQTTCTQAFAGTPQGDDGVRFKTAANVLQGVGGTVYFGDPVANLAALGALTTAHVGEMRVVLDSGAYFNQTGTPGAGNWIALGAASGVVPPPPCASGSGYGAQGMACPSIAGAAPTDASCGAGWVGVPSMTIPINTTGGTMTVPSFCVTQYIVGGSAGAVVSNATSTPFVGVSWLTAVGATSCPSMGGGARLIRESEWMAIAHNVTGINTNWDGGTVGSGNLYAGLRNSTVAGAQAAIAGPNYPSTNTERRDKFLSTGSLIWDIGGNVSQWTYHNMVGGSSGQWGAMPLSERMAPYAESTQGMGWYPSTTAGYTDGTAAWVNLAPTRGGAWSSGANAGAFALGGGGTHTAGIGFRCTK